MFELHSLLLAFGHIISAAGHKHIFEASNLHLPLQMHVCVKQCFPVLLLDNASDEDASF